MIIVAIKLIPTIDVINIKADISGIADGEVSTVKLEPLSNRSETAANCIEPELVVLSIISYMVD